MAMQTQKGKAFEYACLKALEAKLSPHQKVVVESNSALNVAKQFYYNKMLLFLN